ncbi:MAG: hypothetical protein ACYSTL_07920 [Planctomycetota bacterium]|jgi:hypothetical protein
MGESGVRVVRVGNPEAFRLPAVQDFFREAFKGDAHPDPEWVLKWCFEHVEKPTIFIALAMAGSDPKGLTIAEFSAGPFNPHPFSLFSYSSGMGAFDELLKAKRDWSIEISGGPEIDFVNTSGNSDEWYLDRIEHLAEGRPVGSLISCRWKSPGGDTEGETPWDSEDPAEAQAPSQLTLRLKNSRPSEDSSPTSSARGLRAMWRRLTGRSLQG